MNPSKAVFTDVKELENIIREDYRCESVEFSTSYLDYSVEMSKKDMLDLYAELQKEFNGDEVIIPDGDYDEIYKGNFAEFIESCNELEGFKRFNDDEEVDFSF